MASLFLKVITICCVSLSLTSAATNEDVGLNVYELITKYGYQYEKHSVTTEDGYILEVQRITTSEASSPGSRPPILLMHGLFSSSADWVNTGTRSMAFKLVDLGFDVFLGNARGTTSSRHHVTLDPDQNAAEFFNFTWHEIGYYDLPAMIDYILDLTGLPQTQYVGFSQGTTVFFAMASSRPEYNAKIKLMTALAPVAEMKNFKNPIIKIASQFEGIIEFVLKSWNMHELLRYNDIFRIFGEEMCDNGKPTQEMCKILLWAIAGYDREQLDGAFIPVITSNAPGGAALGQLIHYLQIISTDGVMRRFNDGTTEELPEAYDLSQISAPVALYYSQNDWLTSEIDVEHLADTMQNCVRRHRNSLKAMNHIDFQWAVDVTDLVFNDAIDLIVQYN